MADKDSNSKESRFYAKHPVIFGILFAIIPCLLTAYLGYLHGQSEIVDELSKRFDSVEESMSLNDALESAYKDYANVEAEQMLLRMRKPVNRFLRMLVLPGILVNMKKL